MFGGLGLPVNCTMSSVLSYVTVGLGFKKASLTASSACGSHLPPQWVVWAVPAFGVPKTSV